VHEVGERRVGVRVMIGRDGPIEWPFALVSRGEPVRPNNFLPALGLPALWTSGNAR
jgi:hypothetical protein